MTHEERELITHIREFTPGFYCSVPREFEIKALRMVRVIYQETETLVWDLQYGALTSSVRTGHYKGYLSCLSS